ncbi:MAG: helix-turn-helix transcriptional regulator [Bacteroidota bacterium]|nr:helix-turn-helix transcriptional regulator [Bacteroidota bacterium]
MVSNRCKMAVSVELKKLGLHFVIIDLGEVDIMEDISTEERQQLKSSLLISGLELMDDTTSIICEKIKNVIIQMIHNADELPKIKYSDYISEKLHYDYTYLSNLFSKVKGITIQQFILINRIEKAKELLKYGEFNLTEISHRLQYSSVAHLSNQFKQITGFSPTQFMSLKTKERIPIEELGNSNLSIASSASAG